MNVEQQDVEGFVLAGGASSRMGIDKAAIRFNGVTLTDRAVKTLSPVCQRVRIIGGEVTSDLADPIPDIEYPGAMGRRAAINGLYTALSNCEARFAAVLACDMPFVSSELIAFLAEAIAKPGRNMPEAVIPRESEQRIQPLCAIYEARSCKQKLEEMKVGDVPSLWELSTALDVQYIDLQELEPFGDPDILFMNINTPDDLADADAICETIGGL